MKKSHISHGRALTFRRFRHTGWALFAAMGREVRIGVLSASMLTAGAAACMASTSSQASAGCTAAASDAAALPSDATGEPSDPAEEPDTLRLQAIQEVQVRSTLLPQGQTFAGTLLTRDDLAAAGVSTLNDALKLASAVDVRQRGGFSVQTDVAIEGGTFEQVALLLNGVPIGNPQTSHNAADFPVALADVLRIEILEGAAARRAGAGAFSGAINIVTQPAGERWTASAALEGGSKGTCGLEGRVSSKTFAQQKPWHSAFTASVRADRSDGVVQNGDFCILKAYTSALLASDRHSIRIQAGGTVKNFGANTFYSAAYPDQWEATRRIFLAADGEFRLGAIRLSPALSWVRNIDHYELVRGSRFGENRHNGDVLLASLRADAAWVGGHTACEASWRRESIFSTSLGRLRSAHLRGGRAYDHFDARQTLAVQVQHALPALQWGRDALEVHFGAMLHHTPATHSRPHETQFCPGADLTLSLPRRVHSALTLSAERSMRLPSFTELYYKSPTQEGNLGLRSERSATYRLRYRLSARRVSLAVSGFHTRGRSMIDWVMRSADDLYHATTFRLSTWGTTVTASYAAPSSSPSGGSARAGSGAFLRSADISYTYLSQQRHDAQTFFKSCYALEYLRHKLVARVSHRLWGARPHVLSGLTCAWTLRVESRRGQYLVYRNHQPTAEAHPYGTHALLDVRVTWPFMARGHRWEAYAEGQNLTDRHYYDLAGVRQAGFVFYSGIRWKM